MTIVGKDFHLIATTFTLFLFLKGGSNEDLTVETENLNEHLSIKACRMKQRLIDSEANEKFDFVETPLGGRLKLECHYCGESDDYVPKMWWKESRSKDVEISEVNLGTKDILNENRVYMTPEHTLIINEVRREDSGLYYCNGPRGEDIEYRYNYLIDVVNRTVNRLIGKEKDIKPLQEKARNATKHFSSSIQTDYLKIKKLSVNVTVSLEWLPWSACDGCRKIRTRSTTCRLQTVSPQSSETPATDEESFILKSFQISCFSLDLEEYFPTISKDLSSLKTLTIKEPCYAPCKFQFSSSSLPRYTNTVHLKVGDHFTFICPEADSISEISWRKDGVLLEPFSQGENVKLDSFNSLHIIHATKGDHRANYTCYVNKVRMQEILLVVKETSEFHEEFGRFATYLGIMLCCNIFIYAVVLITKTQKRYTFKEVDFSNLDA